MGLPIGKVLASTGPGSPAYTLEPNKRSLLLETTELEAGALSPELPDHAGSSHGPPAHWGHQEALWMGQRKASLTCARTAGLGALSLAAKPPLTPDGRPSSWGQWGRQPSSALESNPLQMEKLRPSDGVVTGSFIPAPRTPEAA